MDKVIQWPLEIWIQMTSLLSRVGGTEKVGCEEIQRAREMGERDLVVC